MADVIEGEAFVRMKTLLGQLLEKAGADDGHGLPHALCVVEHARKALECSSAPEESSKRDAVIYAALLHDADDHKIFPDTSGYANARNILQQCTPDQPELHDLVIRMIEMVSCSSNGNSTAGVDEQTEWMLIPRYADRLEAIGEIGLVRTWQYTLHKWQYPPYWGAHRSSSPQPCHVGEHMWRHWPRLGQEGALGPGKQGCW